MTAKEKAKQIKCYCGHTTYCDCGPLEEPLKETLEEAAKNETKICINEREKQTAVEWLIDELNYIKSSSTKMYGKVQFIEKELNKLLEQAKEMEKQQIEDAWINSLTKGDYNSADEYYNKTFKSE